jgi:ankyrin repeat protein
MPLSKAAYSVLMDGKGNWDLLSELLEKNPNSATCGEFYTIINTLKTLEPLEMRPIEIIINARPKFLLECNKRAANAEFSLWTPVFSGSKEFIKSFIDIVADKAPGALIGPKDEKYPLAIGISQLGVKSENDIIEGLKYLIKKANIDVNSPHKENDPRKYNALYIVLSNNAITKFNDIRLLKRGIAVGYDINNQIHPHYISALHLVLKNDYLIFKVLPGSSVADPYKYDPEIDILSYLLEHTNAVENNLIRYFNSQILDKNPTAFIKFLTKFKKIFYKPDNIPYKDVFIYIISEFLRDKRYAAIKKFLTLMPEFVNIKVYPRHSSSIYAYFLTYAAQQNDLEAVKLLLEFGADINLKDSDGKKACEYARNPDIRALICPPEEAPRPWTGLNRSVIEKYNYIFEQDRGDKPRSPAQDNSFCPVCLTDVERVAACNHMHHNCTKDQPGRYHKELYNKVKDINGNVHWCTLCGRVCIGLVGTNPHAFIHYSLKSVKDTIDGKSTIHRINKQEIQGDPYTHDCSLTVYDSGPNKGKPIPLEQQSFGGGLREKFQRIHRLREYAYDIKNNNKSESEAFKELIEEVWNAPYNALSMRQPKLKNIVKSNKWTRKTAKFRSVATNVRVEERPRPVVEEGGIWKHVAFYADIRRSGCDAEPTEIVYNGAKAKNGEKYTDLMNATSYDDLDEKHKGCRFIHMEEDKDRRPTQIKRHGDDLLFSINTVAMRILEYVKSFSMEDFGKCIAPNECSARIFPEDLVPLLGAGFPRGLFEAYRSTFNWVFGGERLLEGLKPGGEPGPAALLLAIDDALPRGARTNNAAIEQLGRDNVAAVRPGNGPNERNYQIQYAPGAAGAGGILVERRENNRRDPIRVQYAEGARGAGGMIVANAAVARPNNNFGQLHGIIDPEEARLQAELFAQFAKRGGRRTRVRRRK